MQVLQYYYLNVCVHIITLLHNIAVIYVILSNTIITTCIVFYCIDKFIDDFKE